MNAKQAKAIRKKVKKAEDKIGNAVVEQIRTQMNSLGFWDRVKVATRILFNKF